MSNDRLTEIIQCIQENHLTWLKIAELTHEFHNLSQLIHGKTKVGKGSSKTGWSLRDTSNSLARSVGTVWEDIKIIELASDEFHGRLIMKCKYRPEAVKYLRGLKSNED